MHFAKHLLITCLAAAPMASVVAATDHEPQQQSQTAEPKENAVTTSHEVRLHGDSIDYKATAGNLLIRKDDGTADASVFYVAYTVKSDKPRPVTFLYNGGPGSSSIWLHMGSVGPVMVQTADGKPTAPPPYKVTANPNSILDKSDLVFIDAMGTGFSHGIAPKDDKADKGGKKEDPSKPFWGVDQDVDAFARFIERYVTVNKRWNDPKFLMGESYGTTRSAALVNRLQEDGVTMNGVVLVSSILNYGAEMPGLDREYINNLPTYAAIAWYHNKLANKPAELAPFLKEVRDFASGEYAHALAQGQNISESEADAVAQKLHQYTGLSVQYIKEANLQVDPSRFRKELMRDERLTVGRYDGRFMGIDEDAAGETPDTDASDTAVTGAFVAAFNSYLANDLKFDSKVPYKLFAMDAIRTWDWKHAVPGSHWPVPMPYVVADLGNAMRTNPYLKVFSANGYFDLATPFFGTEFDLAHMALPKSLQKNLQFGYYPSGHMIYLNPTAHKELADDLEKFYDQATHK